MKKKSLVIAGVFLLLIFFVSNVFPAEKREIPDIKKWFPMGTTIGPSYEDYGKDQTRLGYADESWWGLLEKYLDDFKAHNMNTVFVCNFSKLEETGRLLDLCEKKGIRVYLQGCNEWFYHFTRRGREKRKARVAFFKQTIEPYVKKHMPLYKDRWGLLCWGLTEEIKPDVADDVKEYYQLVKKLTPKHPGVIIHNQIDSAQKASQIIKPEITGCDVYPYTSAMTPEDSLKRYEEYADIFYRLARDYGANFWMFFQGFKSVFVDDFGEVIFWRKRYPAPSEMKLQAWIAVAHGAKGLFCFNYLSSVGEPRPGGEIATGLRTADWKETEQLTALGEVYGEIGKYTDLLLNLDKEENVSAKVDNHKIEIHQFKEEKSNRTYLIAVNTNTFSNESFTIRLDDETKRGLYDLSTGKVISKDNLAQSLLSGTGRVYLMGTEGDYRDYCRKYRKN